jgi:outer membrane receptor for ferrienterochelin and colicins
MRQLLWLGISLLFCCAVNGLTAQQVHLSLSQESEERNPLPHVKVAVQPIGAEGNFSVLNADSSGKVQLPNSFPMVIRIMAEGFETITDTLRLAQDYAYTLKATSYTLESQVITAQYVPTNSLQSLYKIRVIDSKRIEMQGVVNLADLLSKELNIRLSQDNAIGATAMSLAGISGQNVKILIDGVPMIGRMDGNLDLSQINLNNIERVEIVEGPLSVMYGTDALAGAINLITKKGVAQKKWQSGLNTYYESVGKYNIDLHAGVNIKLKNRVRFSGGRNFFDGWSPVEQVRTQTWRPKEQYFGNFIFERDLGKWKLMYSLNGLHETIVNKGTPNVTSRRAYAFDEYFYTRRLDNTIQLNGYIQTFRYLDFTFGYSHYDRVKNTFYKDLVSLEKKLTPNTEQQDTATFQRLTARGAYSMNKANSKFNYQVGYDIFYEWGGGERIKNLEQMMTDWALFGSIEYRPFSRLTIRPGFRVAYNNLYPAPPTPALNIKYDLTEQISLRGSYSRGFRAPSLKELYLEFVDANHNITGNPNLKAEYSHYYALSLEWKKISDRYFSQADITAFRNDLKDRIFLTQSTINGTLGDPNAPLPFTYINLAGFTAYGIQTNVRYRRKNVSLEAGSALNGNQVSSQNVKSPLVFSPEASLNASYDLIKIKTRLAVFYKFNGRLQSFAVAGKEELMPFYIGSYHTVDITISKNFWKNKVTLMLGGRNVLDVRNVVAQSGGGAHSAGASSQAVGMGRSVLAGLRFNW